MNSLRKKAALFLILLMLALSAAAAEAEYPYSPLSTRDPFYPLVNDKGEILIKEEKEVGDIVLQGIIFSPEGSVVMINNELFREGEGFDNYIINKILPKGIIVEKEGKEFFLKWEG